MSKSADGSERRTAQRRRRQRRATDVNSVEILESMSDGFAAVDREWRYTYVNLAAERNARLRREEMLGRTLWEVFPEFAGSEFESACRRAMDEGVTVHFEEYCAPLDAWFQQTMYPAADGIALYVRDITERKRMEAALDEQQRFIRRITDLSPVMLDVFNVVTGSHSYYSRDVVHLLGHTADQIAQMEDKFSTLLHPEDIPRLRENIECLKRLTDGEINEFECRVRRGDEWRWVSSRSMVFARDEQGHVRQVVNATFDVTERKEASEKLRESEERFRSTFELGLVGMAITSPTKGIVEVNDEFCKISGYERDELLKRTWAEMTHPDDLAADIAQFNRVMAGEIDGYKLGKRFIRKDGRIIDTTISVKALRRADGSVDYFVALLEDITESKRFETLLGAQKRALEMVVGGSPLTEVLTHLASIVERQSANSSIASLMLLDDQGRLHDGAAPSLPADFIQ